MSPLPDRSPLQLGRAPTASLVLLLGAVASFAGPRIDAVNAVVVALLLGLLVANVGGTRLRFDDRVVTVLLKRVLVVAVVLLGAGIELASITDVGLAAIGVTAVAVVLAMSIAWLLGRRLGLGDGSAILVGVGTAICGASAIAAVAPILRASKQDVGVALATVFTFNAVALLVYPLVGTALGLSQAEFGVLAGVGVHDTASAVATGFAYGTEAGELATLVKLQRTLFLLPLLAVTAATSRRRGTSTSTGRAMRGNVPWFVLGFAGLATMNSLGWLRSFGDTLDAVGKLLVVLVVVAVGLTLRLRAVVSIGRPLVVTGLAASAAVGALALVAVTNVPIG